MLTKVASASGSAFEWVNTRALKTAQANPTGALGAFLIAIILAISVCAPIVAPFDPLAGNFAAALAAPSAAHWAGTDQFGRDILSRLIWGSRVSLLVAIGSTFIGLLGGVTLGTIAGYYRGWLESLIMRSMDILFSIPLIVVAVAVIGIVGVSAIKLGPFRFGNEWKVVALLGISYIPPLARITHGAVRAEREEPYVLARLASGATHFRIMLDEVLRNCLSPIIVQATLFSGVAVIVEAALSFLGLGVQPPRPSWGNMLNDGRDYILSGQWWLQVFPGVAISLTVVGFNLLGDALRDVLDPKSGGLV